MANENMDFSFIKDESGVEKMAQQEETITISKSEFIEKATEASKQILKDLENQAKESGNEPNPLTFMSETLTHILLLARITSTLFDGGNK